ncbi:hypothetical protein EG329_007575 [Mollisiaceae sp. DMI_Dod_QoI]|nr:hypothetical protein EG329_007575 [Helotiales sp. DMI_Dod_QoI]
MTQPNAVGPSRASNITLARVPNWKGYGDFCFGRILMSDRKKDKHWSYTNISNILEEWQEQEWTEEEFAAGSSHKPVVEPNLMRRDGPFQFFKLPPEIRYLILKDFLAPFFKYDQTLKKDVVEFSIEQDRYDYSQSYVRRFFEKGVEGYLKRCDETWIRSVSRTEEDRYARLKEIFEFDTKCHPTRTFLYEISASVDKLPVLGNENSMLQTRDFPMIKVVRGLSHLSTGMRNDLGAVLWAQTKVHIHVVVGDSVSNMGPLTCLIDRPNVYNGISYLHLIVVCGWADDSQASTNNFLLICHYLSTYLDLSYLKITVDIDRLGMVGASEEREDVSHGIGCYAGLQLIRSIPVKIGFEVGLNWAYDVNIPDDEFEIRRDEYQRQLHDLLLPNSLRPKSNPQVQTSASATIAVGTQAQPSVSATIEAEAQPQTGESETTGAEAQSQPSVSVTTGVKAQSQASVSEVAEVLGSLDIEIDLSTTSPQPSNSEEE